MRQQNTAANDTVEKNVLEWVLIGKTSVPPVHCTAENDHLVSLTHKFIQIVFLRCRPTLESISEEGHLIVPKSLLQFRMLAFELQAHTVTRPAMPFLND